MAESIERSGNLTAVCIGLFFAQTYGKIFKPACTTTRTSV
jgi:hypothetical protein